MITLLKFLVTLLLLLLAFLEPVFFVSDLASLSSYLSTGYLHHDPILKSIRPHYPENSDHD